MKKKYKSTKDFIGESKVEDIKEFETPIMKIKDITVKIFKIFKRR